MATKQTWAPTRQFYQDDFNVLICSKKKQKKNNTFFLVSYRIFNDYECAKCNNGTIVIWVTSSFCLKSIALSFWLSHPTLHWLMWKVCAEPTTSAGVGLWKCNSHEERPNSPVTPNPPAASPPLCLILLFSLVHHLGMLSCEHCRRRRGREAGDVSWWRNGSQVWAGNQRILV